MYFRTANGIKEHKEGDKWHNPEVIEGWQQSSQSAKENIPWTPFVITLIVLVVGILALLSYEYMKKK